MANYVHACSVKRKRGTGAVRSGGIRQDQLCAVSLQARAVVLVMTIAGPGQSTRCGGPPSFNGPDDLRHGG
jgi:hypothetical protein